MSSPYTNEELIDILNLALDALESPRRGHIYRRPNEPWHLGRDLEKLNACCPDFEITTEKAYWDVILDCLIKALADPSGTYKRPQEPISSHKEALGLEMYSFIVQLDDFTRPIYTKFCLKEETDETWYISIDCHT